MTEKLSQRLPMNIVSHLLWWFKILGWWVLVIEEYLNNPAQLLLVVNKYPEGYKKLPLSMWYLTFHLKSHPKWLTKLCAVLFSLGTFCFLCKCNIAGTEDILDVVNCPVFLDWSVVSLATRYYENLLFQKNYPHTEGKGPKHCVLLLYYIYYSPLEIDWKKPYMVTDSFATKRLAICKTFLAHDSLMLVFKICSSRVHNVLGQPVLVLVLLTDKAWSLGSQLEHLQTQPAKYRENSLYYLLPYTYLKSVFTPSRYIFSSLNTPNSFGIYFL